MIEFNSRVGSKMKEIVLAWFSAEPLARYTLQFIADKQEEKMMFGELTNIHYRMFGGQNADIEAASAAIELFILASDILDDLEDGDAPSKPWMNIPHALSLHIATSLITLSQQALLRAAPNAAMRGELADMMNRQLLQSANGQMLDLMNDIPDEDAYLEMVRQKSASLLVLACMAGVMLAGRPWHPDVADYAAELGIAAQLRNDIRDLLRWDEKSDFLNRKRTLLTLYLLESPEEQSGWLKAYYAGGIDLSEAAGHKALFLQTCEQSGAALYGSVVSRMHYNRFEEKLAGLDADSTWKERLLNLLQGKFKEE
ncbi:hypothetical protein D3P08_19345 [Paenibacillus nanensis]|uniref:Polyprenyl synthetase n=1 Tax=Paenibacillus nanensis TaxID=393251 RepID=A0A3A1UTV6_9BACL|nr:polyprenyl synthetase family protein [Paenibacillus nanensis]RIX50851.1 hypothetical protein D3P08_19345 [Paenibacillus nanensis]